MLLEPIPNASAIALKAPIASPTFTGDVTAPAVNLTNQQRLAPASIASGAGTEGSPYTDSTDNTGGIQTKINALGRGGLIDLGASRFDTSAAIVINTDGLKLTSASAAAGIDGTYIGGASEGAFGAKIRHNGVSAIDIQNGASHRPENVVIEEIGTWSVGGVGSSTDTISGVKISGDIDVARILFCNPQNVSRAIYVPGLVDSLLVLGCISNGNGYGLFVNSVAPFCKLVLNSVWDGAYHGIDWTNTASVTTDQDCILALNAIGRNAGTNTGAQPMRDPANVRWNNHNGLIFGNILHDPGHNVSSGITYQVENLVVANNRNLTFGNSIYTPQVNGAYSVRVKAGASNNQVCLNQYTGSDQTVMIEPGATNTTIFEPGGVRVLDQSAGTTTKYLQAVATKTYGQMVLGMGVTGWWPLNDMLTNSSGSINTVALDISGNANNGTINGPALLIFPSGVANPNLVGMGFTNLHTQSVTLPSISLSGDFTMCWWANLTQNDTYLQGAFGNTLTSTGEFNSNAYNDGAGSTPRWRLNNFNTGDVAIGVSSTLNQWEFICFTRKGTAVTQYRGTLGSIPVSVGTGTLSGTWAVTALNPNKGALILSDCQIYNGVALTIDQITAIYLSSYNGAVANSTPLPNATLPARTPISDANYQMLPTDHLAAMTALTAPRTITLPNPATADPTHTYSVKDESGAAGSHTITISGAIEGGTSKTITANYGSIGFYVPTAGASSWFVKP